MKIGHPFKSRWTGRPPIGMLLVPDILKFKIPVAFAFVKPHPEKDGRALAHKQHTSHGNSQQQVKLLSAGSFSMTKECQKTVQNFNNCIKNNNNNACSYYSNYLKSHCSK
jgi:hypothetical protein